MYKQILTLKEKKIVGISLKTNYEVEQDIRKGQIPIITQYYYRKDIGKQILHRATPNTVHCVYTNYNEEENSSYSFFIGEEVESFEGQNENLKRLTIKEQYYAKFTPEPQSIATLSRVSWDKIRSMNVNELGGKRTYVTDFEIYDCRTKDLQNSIIDIYVGIDTK